MFTDWQTAAMPMLPRIVSSFSDSKCTPRYLRHPADERESPDEAKKVRIIVIDDETVIAETVVEILREDGFEATAVSNSSSAIALAQSYLPDIVLSDVIMPGMNGIETGIKIREIVPQCRIILFSGQAATVDLLEKARQQGHRFDILAKPIRPERLIAAIRAGSGHTS